MRAMVLEAPRSRLAPRELPDPQPGAGQVLLRVSVCGVCRTDLHVLDGELDHPKLPLVLGHEIVGRVERVGPDCERFAVGARVGVPWVGFTCGACDACRRGQENLCESARFTGYTLDGGYAELAVADERYCFALPDRLDDVHAAPLLCAGLIGLRSLRMAGDPQRVGLYGFGAAAHLMAQIARHEGREVYAFTREGDTAAQALARSLGAVWVGSSTEAAPVPLDAAIVMAPVGALVPTALRATRPGGTVVCGGIHMSDIPSFPYALLWGERTIRSVANLTRGDGDEMMRLAEQMDFDVHVDPHPLSEANEALDALRSGRVRGAAVLRPASG